MNESEMLSEAFFPVIRSMCILWLQAVMAPYQNANDVLLAAASAAQAALDQSALTSWERRGREQTLS